MVALDGYVAKSRIHISELSEVWAAVRASDGRAMVLKRSVRAEDDARQIEREFNILRQLEGPAIPAAVEVVRDADGAVWLVQERAPGVRLSKWAGRGKVSIAHWLQVALDLADVLARVHRARILHRDVHPGNVLVHPDTLEVHLIDLGAAHTLGSRARTLGSRSRSHVTSSAATAVGVLSYIAPEQTGRMDRGVDFRSDLYSLGATLYHALTGSPPFPGTDPLALIHAHMARRPTPATELRSDVPDTVSRILLKLLQKEPGDRYQSAEGLAADLRECLTQLDATGRVSDD